MFSTNCVFIKVSRDLKITCYSISCSYQNAERKSYSNIYIAIIVISTTILHLVLQLFLVILFTDILFSNISHLVKNVKIFLM